ncbi:ATP-binding cassette domain-containing protein [Mucilaginibacter sp. P25]|uniref:ATP-binding cassette domain-containing protein n=1 Tax=unclassified Mucilaginibacter TaxID=2617802 RepID=UPI003D67B02A
MISIDIEIKLKAYHGGQLLKINRQFNTGSIIKILGPSGSGKTTLLKMIAGLGTPENGVIMANGVTWFDSREKINLSPQKEMLVLCFKTMACFRT